jgi:hypothetical protein
LSASIATLLSDDAAAATPLLPTVIIIFTLSCHFDAAAASRMREQRRDAAAIYAIAATPYYVFTACHATPAFRCRRHIAAVSRHAFI